MDSESRSAVCRLERLLCLDLHMSVSAPHVSARTGASHHHPIGLRAHRPDELRSEGVIEIALGEFFGGFRCTVDAQQLRVAPGAVVCKLLCVT